MKAPLKGTTKPKPPVSNNTDSKNNRHWPPQDPPMFWVTLAAFIGACVYGFYAREQAREVARANEISEKAIVVSNRPYLLWASYSPKNEVDGSGKQTEYFDISVVYKNFGKVPATSVFAKLCDPIVRDTAAKPSFVCSHSEALAAPVTVGPDHPANLVGPRLTASQVIGIANQTLFAYVFGSIFYKSVLDPSAQYETRFCHRLFFQKSGPTDLMAIDCDDPRWNCMDSDCPKD